MYLKGFSYFSGMVVGLVLDENVDVLQADAVACVPDMGEDRRLTIPTSMVFESGAHGASCFADIEVVAGVARDLVDYSTFVTQEAFVFGFDQHGTQRVVGFVINLDTVLFVDALQFFR